MVVNTFIFTAALISCTLGERADTVIKWSEKYQLQYADFKSEDKATHTNHKVLFTSAIIQCTIQWKVRIDSGRNRINAYAVFFPEKSYMSRKQPDVLKHEQGHFDIAEIYAKKMEQQVNDANISDVKEFFFFLAQSYDQVSKDCLEEQTKYDEWTRNTPGEEYYYKWIEGQLRDLKCK